MSPELRGHALAYFIAQRQALNGFIALGNELERAAMYDRFIAELTAPTVMPTTASEAVAIFAIEVEKLLCKKLGIDWAPTGLSIESLVDRLAAPAAGEQAGAVAWQWVPKKATPEMILAMAKAWQDAVSRDDTNECVAEWDAALLAAPGAAIAAREQEAPSTLRGEVWDDNPDGIVPGQERGPRMNPDTGFYEE